MPLRRGARLGAVVVLGLAVCVGRADVASTRGLDIAAGRALFERIWVSSPSSTRAADGLGPLFNARSCAACHPGGGGGRLVDEPDASMLLRLRDASGAGDPVYGVQLQTFAVPGLPAEGRLVLDFETRAVPLADGETIILRRPRPRVDEPGYGPIAPGTRLSPRLAPRLAGAGVIEAIDDDDIAAMADPADADGDGISGRLHWLASEAYGRRVPGRFGFKATAAGIDEQTRIAFVHDIGISVPGREAGFAECTQAQQACRLAPHGDSPDPGDPEASAQVVDLVNGFVASLPPPAPRERDADARAGAVLFDDIGCSRCHRAAYTVRADDGEPRVVMPYTDLLLHDLGEGLSDGAPEGDAAAGEWRTAPLWGVGAAASGGNASLLHDGRARSLLEAILWHGGEAAGQAERVRMLSARERGQLIRFLETL